MFLKLQNNLKQLNKSDMFKKLLPLIIFLGISKSYGQYSIRDSSISFVMIGVTAAYQFPSGDMADRFGNNMNVGAVFQWKFKNNWIAGIEGNFLFSDDVKENNILNKYMTPDGNIIDGNGQYSEVSLSQRGLKIDLKAGKIFPLFGPNKNSGVMTTLGIGYLQHKIYIDTFGNPIPYLEGDYTKGYDRLTTGVCLTAFLGYVNFSNSKLVNFYAGFEFTQGFTKNRRSMNFDTGLKDDKSRMDMLFGFRLGWVFPIYKRIADKSYIN
jgi:hypothetical protein